MSGDAWSAVWLFDAACKSVIVLGVTAVLVWRLRRRSAALRHLVWAAALISLPLLPLITAVVPGWRLGLFISSQAPPPRTLPASIDQADVAQVVAPRDADDDASTATMPYPQYGNGRGDAAGRYEFAQPLVHEPTSEAPGDRGDVASRSLEPSKARTMEQMSLPQVVRAWCGARIRDGLMHAVNLWLFGVAMCILPIAMSWLGLWRLSALCRPVVESRWLTDLDDACRSFGVTRPVRLVTAPTSRVPVPMTWGMRRPTVALPSTAVAWSDGRRRVVIRHELAHVRRRDAVVQLAARLVTVLYWFNPLVWWAGRRLRIEAEQAADDLVLCAGDRASEYAQHLVAIAAGLRRRPAGSVVGVAMARRSTLEGRVLAILDEGRRRVATKRGMTLAVLALGAIALIASCVRLGVTSAENIAQLVEPQWTARLDDGTTVSLLGVAADDEGQSRWTPDGGSMPIWPRDARTPWRFDEPQRRFALLVDDVETHGPAHWRVRVPAARGDMSVWSTVAATTFDLLPIPGADVTTHPTVAVYAVHPPEADTDATLVFERASGAWHVCGAIDVTDAGVHSDKFDGPDDVERAVAWSGPTNTGDGATLVLTAAPSFDASDTSPYEWRYIGVASDGQEHEARAWKQAGQGEELHMLRLTFPKLRAASLRSLRIEYRPYNQRVEFRNVSLEPGFETQPEVVVVRGVQVDREFNAIPSQFELGPLVERTVEGGWVEHTDAGTLVHGRSQFIDFDSGRLLTRPAGLDETNPDAVRQWFERSGADAGPAFSQSIRGLVGWDMYVSPRDFEWDQITASTIADDIEWRYAKRGAPIPIGSTGRLPATFLFATRDGARGVLQIVGFTNRETDGVDGVSIRYRLLEKRDSGKDVSESGENPLHSNVYIYGVGRPGTYGLPADKVFTFRNLLATADADFAAQADSWAHLFRLDGTGRTLVTAIRLGDMVDQDLAGPVLQGRDVIIVREHHMAMEELSSDERSDVEIRGAVSKPGAYAIPSGGLTLVELLMVAGGVTTKEVTDSSLYVMLEHSSAQTRSEHRPALILAHKADDPQLRPGDRVTVAERVVDPASSPTSATAAPYTTLRLLDDATGKPIRGVKLTITADAEVTRLLASPGKDGLVPLTLPQPLPQTLMIELDKRGYVPLAAEWKVSEGQHPPLGATLTARMPKATTIGGIIVDEQDQPISGATVTVYVPRIPNGPFFYNVRNRPYTTNDRGEWRCDVFPPGKPPLCLRISHPDYVGDDHYNQRPWPSYPQLRAMTGKTVMRKGVPLTGRVVDLNGQPVAAVRVYKGSKPATSGPRTPTGPDGRFNFGHVDAQSLVLTVDAPGYGRAVLYVDVAPDMGPVELIVGPPVDLLARLIDPAGQPIGGAVVMLDGWGAGQQPGHMATTDDEGRFSLRDVPRDSFKLQVRQRGAGASQTVTVPEGWSQRQAVEVLLTVSTPLSLRGRVTDADTGQPIGRFTVTPGFRWAEGGEVTWQPKAARTFTNGAYDMPMKQPYPWQLIRIEADGYAPWQSPTFARDAGEQIVDVELQQPPPALEHGAEEGGGASGKAGATSLDGPWNATAAAMAVDEVRPAGANALTADQLALRFTDAQGQTLTGVQVGLQVRWNQVGDNVPVQASVSQIQAVGATADGAVVFQRDVLFKYAGASQLISLYAYDATQNLAGVAQFTADHLGREHRLILQPTCEVAATVTCAGLETLGKALTWSNIYVRPADEHMLPFGSAWSDDRRHTMLLPPGTYNLWAYGTDTYGAMRTITIEPGQTDLEVTIDVPESRLVHLIGKPAPELRQIKGWKNTPPLRLEELRGKVVLLEFWGYWCGPCIGMMPELMKLHDEYAEYGLVIIGVHDDSVDTIEEMNERLSKVVREHWDRRDLPFAVALDGGGETPIEGTELAVRGATTATYGIQAWPSTVLIDREGILHGTTRNTLEEAVRALLGLPEKWDEPQAEGVPDWERRFNEVYRLEIDDVMRRIAPPFIPERQTYYKMREPTQAEAIEQPPDYFRFRWDGGLRRDGYGFRGGDLPLQAVLTRIVKLAPYEFEGADEALNLPVAGDWIVREDTSVDERLAALEAIFAEQFGRDIRFVHETVERDVLVATGRFAFKPLAGTRNDGVVHIYAQSRDPDEQQGWQGGGSGTVDEFIRWMGGRIGRHIINQTTASEGDQLEWENHRDSRDIARNPGVPGRLKMLLHHLTRQTSLEFRPDRRQQKVWMVVEGPNGANDAAPRPIRTQHTRSRQPRSVAPMAPG